MLKEKIEKSINRIKEFEPKEGYWLAFSGGKDSIVIEKLMYLAGVNYESHYNITNVDPPELVKFIKENYPDVIFHQPEQTMWKLIEEKRMPPTRLVRYCCEKLKERGGEGRFVVTGVRWAESYKRKTTRAVVENAHANKKFRLLSNDNHEGHMMLENCIKKGKFILNPIIDWEDKDIWDFIERYKMKYCSLYNEGFKRLGCIGCPMCGKLRYKEFERFPKYKDMYLKAFNKMLINRKEKGLKTDWETAEEVFSWWMEENKGVIKNQIKMELRFL